MIIKQVISGGQTGADQGGLFAASAADIPTGGWIAAGWKTEDGLNEALEGLGLEEHPSENYAARTLANVLDGDVTLIFGKRSNGSNLTEALCIHYEKPWMRVPVPCADQKTEERKVREFLVKWAAKEKWGKVVVNVAGNRESVNPGIGEFVEQFMEKVFAGLKTGGGRK